MSVNAQRVLGILLFSETMFLASTFGTWIVACVLAGFAAVVVWARSGRHSRVEGTEAPSRFRRWLIGISLTVLFSAVFVATAAWRWSSQVGESINPIYVGVDVLAHVAFFSSLVAWTLRPSRGHVSMLSLGLVVVLLCVAAGGASSSFAAQTTVALAACLGFTLASQIILSAQRGEQVGIFVRDRTEAGRTSWLGPLFSLLTLSVLMMATSAIANATNYVLPGIQERLRAQLQASMDSVADETFIGGTRYVRGSRLGEIRKHMMGDPQEIALRVFADVIPGYLRGHAFDQYSRRRWWSADRVRFPQVDSIEDRLIAPTGNGTAQVLQSLNRPLKRFPFEGETNEETINLEIRNDPLKGQLVFLPLTTRWLEANSSELVLTSHDIVRLGVDVTKPYVAGVGLGVLREPLDPLRRELLLRVPDSVATQSSSVADAVCSNQATTATKAAALSQFFQREFTYSLASTKAPRRVDPLSHFLETKHPAHCEYFASATVMVLRSAGIPARYVTGYVVDEFSDDEDSWVARNLDAHAWAEAYDDSTQKWFPVESTPGRTYQTVDPEVTASGADSLFDVFGTDDDDDNDSLISRVLGWILSTRVTDPLLLIFRVGQLPLFCVLVYLLWAKYLKPNRSDVDPIDLQSQKMLRVVDRRLRKHALVRLPSETPYQFADRIEARRLDEKTPLNAETDRRLASISRWYRQYADARYQGRLPSPLGSA